MSKQSYSAFVQSISLNGSPNFLYGIVVKIVVKTK